MDLGFLDLCTETLCKRSSLQANHGGPHVARGSQHLLPVHRRPRLQAGASPAAPPAAAAAALPALPRAAASVAGFPRLRSVRRSSWRQAAHSGRPACAVHPQCDESDECLAVQSPLVPPHHGDPAGALTRRARRAGERPRDPHFSRLNRVLIFLQDPATGMLPPLSPRAPRSARGSVRPVWRDNRCAPHFPPV